MKTVLISGIGGFLGSHLAKEFHDNNYHVIGIARSKKKLPRLNNYDLRIYNCKDELDIIFKENKIFSIIHTATIYSTERFENDDLIFANIVLPLKLYQLGNKYGVKQFLNTDSYFNNKNQNYSYLKQYSLSKKHSLEWLKCVGGNCKLVNMKLFHMYGPNDSKHKFVTQMINKFCEGIASIDVTFAQQTRDFIYVSDVVSAYKKVLEMPLAINNYTEYEIGMGEEISIRQFLIMVKEITGSNTKINFGSLNYRKNEIMSSKADIKRLINIGWEPKISIDTGIKSIIGDKI